MPLCDLWQWQSQESSSATTGDSADTDTDTNPDLESLHEDEVVPREQPTLPETEEGQKLRRQRQTAKARARAIAAKHERRLVAKERLLVKKRFLICLELSSYASFDLSPMLTAQFSMRIHSSARRTVGSADELCSYLSAFAWKVAQLFLPGGGSATTDTNTGVTDAAPESEQFPRVISSYVVDDTNMTLLSAKQGSYEVRTALNCLQRHLVVRSDSGRAPTWFQFHQPLIFLQSPSSQEIHQHFLAWALSFCNEAGPRLQLCGVPKQVFAKVRMLSR